MGLEGAERGSIHKHGTAVYSFIIVAYTSLILFTKRLLTDYKNEKLHLNVMISNIVPGPISIPDLNDKC